MIPSKRHGTRINRIGPEAFGYYFCEDDPCARDTGTAWQPRFAQSPMLAVRLGRAECEAHRDTASGNSRFERATVAFPRHTRLRLSASSQSLASQGPTTAHSQSRHSGSTSAALPWSRGCFWRCGCQHAIAGWFGVNPGQTPRSRRGRSAPMWRPHRFRSFRRPLLTRGNERWPSGGNGRPC
jgi:hypothetical protein